MMLRDGKHSMPVYCNRHTRLWRTIRQTDIPHPAYSIPAHTSALFSGCASTNTSKLWPEHSRSTSLLLTVVVPVSTGSAVCALSSSTGSTHSSRTRGTCGLFMCGGNNFSGEMQPGTTAPRSVPKHKCKESWHAPFTQVFDTFGGKDVVIPLPRELGLNESLGCQALHRLDDLQVGYA